MGLHLVQNNCCTDTKETVIAQKMGTHASSSADGLLLLTFQSFETYVDCSKLNRLQIFEKCLRDGKLYFRLHIFTFKSDLRGYKLPIIYRVNTVYARAKKKTREFMDGSVALIRE